MPKVILPTTPPFNLLFFRRVPPGFRRVPPGSARLRRVLVGSGRRVSASLGLLQGSREAVRFASSYKFFFPSFCQAPAVSNARPVATSHNLSVLFPKQFSAELSAQHCLPEGRRLLEQLCCEIKAHATNLSSPMRGAGRWRPLTVSLAGAKSDNENPVCTWCPAVNY